MNTPAPTPITAKGIAELAGVTIAAVGQWRKRSDDFPKPLDPQSRRATYDRDAVLAWLEQTGRPIQASGNLSQLFRSFSFSRDLGEVLALFAAKRHADINDIEHLQEPLQTELSVLFSDEQTVEAYAAAASASPSELLEAADEELSRSRRDAGFASPPAFNRLLAALTPGSSRNIIDVACGVASSLDAVVQKLPNATVTANDLATSAVALAQARALVRDWAANWSNKNALSASAFEAETYDLVTTVPPWGMHHDKETLSEHPERWPYGEPRRVDDTVWLQLAHHLLSDEGTGMVTLSLSSLTQKSGIEVISKMTTDQSLQAVVELPERLHLATTIGTALLIFQKKPQQPTDTVLFLSFEDPEITEGPGHHVTDLDTKRVTTAVTDHLAHRPVETGTHCALVSRLELVGSRKPFTPSYWITSQNKPSASDLKSDLTTAVSGLENPTPASEMITNLTVTNKATGTTPLSDLSGVTVLRRKTNEDLEGSLIAGDVCAGPRGVNVCTDDGVRPGTPIVDVFRCDMERTDPWFLAAVIASALNAGTATPARGPIPRLQTNLIEVPVLGLEQQRALGQIYRSMKDQERKLQEEIVAWNAATMKFSDVLASGYGRA